MWCRANYTRSLAVMSMVGYVLGLGDRHPSNLMLDRKSGKVLHIDFGDCFEVAMQREKFPERIPFRLTRMLVNKITHTSTWILISFFLLNLKFIFFIFLFFFSFIFYFLFFYFSPLIMLLIIIHSCLNFIFHELYPRSMEISHSHESSNFYKILFYFSNFISITLVKFYYYQIFQQ